MTRMLALGLLCPLLMVLAGCTPVGVVPGIGDIGASISVGDLDVAKDTSHMSLLGDETETFTLDADFGKFVPADDGNQVDLVGDMAQYSDVMSNFDSDTFTAGDCKVTTYTFTIPADAADGSTAPDEPNDDDDDVDAWDPGNPGVASSTAANVQLERVDNPDTNALDGGFDPTPAGVDLLAEGFDAGQEITFTFPGGADIGAFNASINVPADLNITAPNLSATESPLIAGQALQVNWSAGNASEYVIVSIGSSEMPMMMDGEDDADLEISGVSIECKFADDGSGLIPAAATAPITDDHNMVFFVALREREKQVNVPFLSGNRATVELTARVTENAAWMEIPGFNPDDIPDDLPDDIMDELPDDIDEIPDIPDDIPSIDEIYAELDSQELCVLAGGTWDTAAGICRAPE